MKKVRVLQILVYIVFGLFIFQNMAAGAWQGFKDGYNEVGGTNPAGDFHGPPLLATIDGGFIAPKTGGELKIGDNYTLKNIIVNADISINHNNIATPWLLTIIKISLMILIVVIMIRVAYTINKVIVKIVEGVMFEAGCIKLIKNTGIMLLLYTLADYAWQQADYHLLISQLNASLKIINTSRFDFAALMFAILVFIIAEAFKQAARLKEEQALTI
jgi:hypothetical protein